MRSSPLPLNALCMASAMRQAEHQLEDTETTVKMNVS